jgi:cobalt-zinc-cadmium efflux system protein
MVKSGAMLAVAAVGLLANLFTAGLLYRSQHENLNIRGAFLHVVGDTLGSVGAIAAGIAMVVWQWYMADPLVSVVVAVLVLYSSWQLVRESVDVLLEGTPRHLNISSILSDLGTVGGVLSVHDLHVWSITSGMPAMSCHIVIRSDQDSSTVLASLSRMMKEKYQIEHTTIQIERENWVVPMVGSKPLF